MRNLNFLVKDIFIRIKMGLSDACHFLKWFEVWIFYVYQESKSLWIEHTNDKFRISRINLHCSYKNYTRYWHHSQLLCKFYLWQLFIILIKWQRKAPTLKFLKQWQALNVHGHWTNQIVVRGQSRKGKEVEVFMAMQLLIFWKSAIFLWEGWETGQGGQNSKVAPKTPPSYASSLPTWVGMSLRNTMYVTFMSMLHYMAEGILQM